MPAVQQDRGFAVRRRQLQSPRRRHVGGLHFGNHTRERSVAQRVLGHRQHFNVFAALCVEQLFRPQPDLFETRRIEIEGGNRPQDVEALFFGKARRDAGEKQRGGSVVVQPGGRSSDLM